MAEDASYLLLRNNRYYYFRRLPDRIRKIEKKTFVKISLKTDSKRAARVKARLVNAQIEKHWLSLLKDNVDNAALHYNEALEIANEAGFEYLPASKILGQDIGSLIARFEAIDRAGLSIKSARSLLGTVEEEKILLSQCFEMYCKYSKNRLIKRSERQIRKWENPRKLAVNNFIEVNGDKFLQDISRDDLIRFRDWWGNRISHETYSEWTANKSLIHVKDIFSTISDNLKLDLDKAHLFYNIFFKKPKGKGRRPFSTEHILTVILADKNHMELTHDEKWFLYAMAETGARDSELVNLNKETIFLEHEVPHIYIKDSKTESSERVIPLVGYALDAFRKCPYGFVSYYQKADELSTTLNKKLRNKGLFPSEKHSVYSLRHSFQDRLIASEIPPRVQKELMGHALKPEDYGDGATLKHKLKYMKKVALKTVK